MKLWLIDDKSMVLGTIEPAGDWEREAQAIADETAAFLVAVLGNVAGHFVPGEPAMFAAADLDAMAAVRAVSDRSGLPSAHAAEIAAWRERVAKLEGYATRTANDKAAALAKVEHLESVVVWLAADNERLLAQRRQDLAEIAYLDAVLAVYAQEDQLLAQRRQDTSEASAQALAEIALEAALAADAEEERPA